MFDSINFVDEFAFVVLLLQVILIIGGRIMRVTTKGQVTIPQHIREKLGITPATEVDFVEEEGRIYLVKQKEGKAAIRKFEKLRGSATVKMNTDEIMALTRSDK
jgi:AbrB family looped-hinge helix DNA binding protein